MPTPFLWRLIRLARSVPDRLGHKGRRRAVLERLRSDIRPQSVLVVCQGNLCRSPYAEAVLRRHFAHSRAEIGVNSAGFFTPNRPPPADALEAASARGIDMSAHRSRVVSLPLLDASDLIVVMDPYHAMAVNARGSATLRRIVVLGDLDPKSIRNREIADPFGETRAAFDECYARIDRCAAELARALLAARP